MLDALMTVNLNNKRNKSAEKRNKAQIDSLWTKLIVNERTNQFFNRWWMRKWKKNLNKIVIKIK
jgi:hypothetical protein